MQYWQTTWKLSCLIGSTVTYMYLKQPQLVKLASWNTCTHTLKLALLLAVIVANTVTVKDGWHSAGSETLSNLNLIAQSKSRWKFQTTLQHATLGATSLAVLTQCDCNTSWSPAVALQWSTTTSIRVNNLKGASSWACLWASSWRPIVYTKEDFFQTNKGMLSSRLLLVLA